jgi:pyruvate ferredoxin oxidoreductase gamma subunit
LVWIADDRGHAAVQAWRVFEVRIHGRGGQGVVTAAELLSVAAFIDGRHAQAFPSFGSERTGAPVVAFCRIAERPIRTREPVMEPDALIVQDPTLLHQAAVFGGLRPSGYILINSPRDFDSMGIGEFVEPFSPERLLALPASEIAREHLGRPLPGAPLLGGFAALARQVSIASVEQAIAQRFSGRVAAGNGAAAREAYERVIARTREPARV